MTGSSGGSLTYSLQPNIVGITLIDGTGNVSELTAGTEDFDAAIVSMGLFGVISRVKIRGVPRFGVRGVEKITNS